MGIRPQRLLLSSLLALILALGSGASAQQPTTVSLAPPITLAPGASGVIDGHIACNADGCSAFAVTVAFDPAVVQVDSVEVGPILGEDVFVAQEDIDNAAGRVQLTAVALGDLPETEEDVLFRLHVTALAEGAAILHIQELEVGDLMGNPLAVEAIDGAVFVTTVASGPAEVEPEATPEATAEAEATPEATIEPEATEDPLVSDPCFVYIEEVAEGEEQPEVFIRVGPGYDRGVRGNFPLGMTVLVVGKAEDGEGVTWWKIQPPGYLETEADRYWVAHSDVAETGDCERVGEAAASAFVAVSAPKTTGGWGACGSCNTCGDHPLNECILSPEGQCLWHPAACAQFAPPPSSVAGPSVPGGPPPLVASASASPTSGNAPLYVNFTGGASGGTSPYTYSWNFGQGGTSTSKNPSNIVYMQPSGWGWVAYDACLTVRDSAGKSATRCVQISVNS